MGDGVTQPSLDWKSSNLPESFRLFKQRTEIFLRVKDIEAAEKQVDRILLGLGDEGLKRFNSWRLPADEKKKPDVIWNRLEQSITNSSKPNFRVARLHLHYMHQRQEESLDDFVFRCQEQTAHCEFTDNEESERIIEQIIASTPIEEYQKFLLDQNKAYTLQQALTEGRKHEATIENRQKIKELQIETKKQTEAETAEIAEFKSRNRKPKTSHQQSKKSRCRCCGLDHPRNKESCPAKDDECHSCGKIGHWSDLCFSKETETPKRHNQQRDKRRPRQNRNVHYITQEQSTDDDDGEYEQYEFNEIKVSNVCLDTQTNPGDEAFMDFPIHVQHINLKKKPRIRAKLDTGAGANTLPRRMYKNIFPMNMLPNGDINPTKIQPAKVRLTAYNGTRIKCHGTTTLRCKSQDVWHNVSFYIVASPGPAVLGLPTMKDLKIITIHGDVRARKDTFDNTNTISAITKQQTQSDSTEQHGQNRHTKPNRNNHNRDKLKKQHKTNKWSTPDQTIIIRTREDLIGLYPDRFDKLGELPGEAVILLKDDAIPHQDAPRKWPIHIKIPLESEVDRLEALGIIRKMNEHADYVSTITFAFKGDGSIRICINPNHLNKCIKRCAHKTPTLEEISYKLKGAKKMTKLDAKDGYWSVKVAKQSQPLTTFRTPKGKYCYQRLPMGLATSQDIFQSKMDDIIADCPVGVIGITDDVVIHGKSDEEHSKNLHNFMLVARKHGLTFKSSKTYVAQDHVKFFGMIFSEHGMHPDPEKVEDVHSMPVPQNKKEVQEFMGLIQYLSPFTPELAIKSAPIRDLLKKDTPFDWDTQHDECYQELKNLITSDACVRHYDTQAPTQLMTDASLRGLGASLLQPDENGQYRPVAFASKSLTQTQSNYSNIEREMLAIVFGIERFHTFLYARQFKIITDHKPLVSIMSKNIHSAPMRLQQMLHRIQGYTFDIEYRPGPSMGLADSLSRLPNPHKIGEVDLVIRIDYMNIKDAKLQEIKNETRIDPVLQCLRDVVHEGWPNTIKEIPTDIREYWDYRDEISVYDGLLLKGERIIIPTNLRQNMLTQLHYGHLGMRKTSLRAKSTIFWPKINKEIETICQSCGICEKYQKSQTKETLLQHEIPTEAWDTLGTDLFHCNGREFVIIVDYYSKYPVVKELPAPCPSSKLAKETSIVLAEFGIPKKIVSDNGPHFIGTAYKNMIKSFGIDHVPSSPRHPKSNGLAERMIQTVKSTIRKTVEAGENVDLAILTLRTTPIDDKLPSPAELIFGRKIRGTLPIVTRNQLPARDDIRERFHDRQDKQKFYHDRMANDLSPLYRGQKVVTQNHVDQRWYPATVMRKCDEPRSYIIQNDKGNLIRRNRIMIRPSSSQQEPAVGTEANNNKNLPRYVYASSPTHDSAINVQAPHTPRATNNSNQSPDASRNTEPATPEAARSDPATPSTASNKASRCGRRLTRNPKYYDKKQFIVDY